MMYMTTSLILILTLLINGIQCPGAGGIRKEGEEKRVTEKGNIHRTTGGYDRSKTSEMPTWAVVIIVVVIIVMLPFIYCAMCCSRKKASISYRDNHRESVGLTAPTIVFSEQNPFQTGIWSFQYHQYGKWHGPYRIILSFDHQLHHTTGKGADDVGCFICDGLYFPQNHQLNLTLRYDHDTGNPEENFGHTSNVVLHWDSVKNVFVGTWHVQTHTYSGEGKFEMEFKEHIKPSLKTDYPRPIVRV